MQALVLTAPHAFEIGDIPKPEPKENEVLCRVRAIAICGTDTEIIEGSFKDRWPRAYPAWGLFPSRVEIPGRFYSLSRERRTAVEAGCLWKRAYVTMFCYLCRDDWGRSPYVTCSNLEPPANLQL